MKIPLVDLKAQHDTLKDELEEAIKKVIETSRFIGGEEVAAFENEFASYCGKKHAISTSSGTSALYITIQSNFSLGKLKEGDEIITTPNTFTASAAAIHQCGGKIKFVDVDEHHLMDVQKLREAITPETKAILPIDLYGQPANVQEILEIAREKNLLVISDSAQAHGAEQGGRKTPLADTGIFSFFPAKPLGALGDGGAVVTNDDEIANKVRQLRDHGRSDRAISKYEHSLIGLNFRLDALKAATLRVKLRHLDKWNAARRRIASLYNELLADIPDIELPREREGNKHVYYVYTVMTGKRDQLASFLKENGISTQMYYPIPLHLQEAYKFLGHQKGDFPVSEKFSQKILSIPMYPELTEDKIRYITDKIKEFFKNE